VVARAESEVEIRISDDGEGIAAEFLPHLFDRFRQADAGAARTHGGLGLGLALVKQLVELHGGEVTAASDGPGRGATFTIALPLATLQTTDDRLPAPRTTVEPPPGEGEITDLEGVSVLVVDDEPDALEMVRRILVERRAAVVAASGTNEALPLIAQRRFDVIVSDIAMPDRDGYEFMKECRTRGVTTPAIALTAFAGARDRTMALFAGYQSHVSKPVDPTELLATIAAFMRSTPK
jgi:CheY-like chemotaxis protein